MTGLARYNIQRAYANWGDGRLTPLERDVTRLGWTPVQTLGFESDDRNMADFQMALDALEYAIDGRFDVVTIVSGDGAFAALTEKLKQYDVRVIGAAYPQCTSNRFRAMCDDFVKLVDPEKQEQSSRPDCSEASQESKRDQERKSRRRSSSRGRSKTTGAPGGSSRSPSARRGRHGIVQKACQELGRLTEERTEGQEIRKIFEALRWSVSSGVFSEKLDGKGVSIAYFGHLLHRLIPGLETRRHGFSSLTELVSYHCDSMGKPLRVRRNSDGQGYLVLDEETECVLSTGGQSEILY